MLSSVISLLVIFNLVDIKSDETVTASKTLLPTVKTNSTSITKLNLETINLTTAYTNLNNDTTHTTYINNIITVPPSKLKCRAFQTCIQCVRSPISFRCDWCHDFGCTDKADNLCPTAKGIISTLPVNDKCPRIEHRGSILIPTGVKINLKVKLHAPDPIIYDKELICQLKLKDRLSHLKGILIGEIIYCYPVTLDIKSDEISEKGILQVIWGGTRPISNIVSVIVYKCEEMGVDCESCKDIPVEYGCGWCRKTESCVIGDKCSDDFMKWTISRVTCDELEKKLFYV